MKYRLNFIFLLSLAISACALDINNTEDISALSHESQYDMTKAVNIVSLFSDIDLRRYTTYLEKVEACQIPDELLSTLETAELVKICTEYPLLLDIFSFNSFEEGWERQIDFFNGFHQLIKNKDYYHYITNYIDQLANDLENYKTMSDSMKGSTTLSLCLWEYFLTLESNIKYATNEDLAHVLHVLNKIDNSLSKIDSDSFLHSVHKHIRSSFTEAQTRSWIISDYEYTNQDTLYTPNGTAIWDNWISSGSMSIFEKTSLRNYIQETYHNVEILEDPDPSYNCHFYAWMGNATNNRSWLGYYSDDSENSFWTDGSYIETPSSEGNIVSYLYANHSAIKSGAYYISKWGSNCLVRHSPEECPYVLNNIPISSQVKSYKLAMELNGPSSVSKSVAGGFAYGNFNVSNASSNASYTWSVDETAEVISGQGTPYAQIRFQGPSNVNVHIQSLSGNYHLFPKYVTVNSPVPNVYGISVTDCYLEQGAYVLEVMTNQPEANFIWLITDENGGNVSSYFRDLTYANDTPYCVYPNKYKEVVFTQAGTFRISVGGYNSSGTEWYDRLFIYDGTTIQ